MQKNRSAETTEITHLHGQPDLLRFSDRYLCSQSLEKLLSATPATRRRWLRRVKQSRAQQQQDGARRALITAYFFIPP
jgi:hypothetical protein